MIREKIAQTNFGKDNGFRWRGKDISRVEGFSDNVFGFALTLLVVSLEVPKTFSDLEQTFQGFIAFALAFAFLFSLWFYHYKFFRRYGIEDTAVIWLNAFLLFVILFFVYPLKFLFTYLVKMFSGISTKVALEDGTFVPSIMPHQWTPLMIAYGLGVIIIFGVFMLLNIYAYRKRDELDLNEVEIIVTKGSIAAHCGNCIIGLISISIVLIWGNAAAALSGLTYCLIGPVQGVVGWYYGRKIESIRNAMLQSS